jgi:hypothetical protein
MTPPPYWVAFLVGTFIVSLALWWAGWMSMATGRNIMVGLALVTVIWQWRRRTTETRLMPILTAVLAILFVLSLAAELGLWFLQQSGVGGG